ncbi:MAG TPA: aminotransferase [Myxococcales bacterium]|nr:aminotransferase [Myxococcales bacterium]
MKRASSVYRDLGTTIFEATSRRAAELGAVNLGQGFPDDRGPQEVLQAASEALLQGGNQYPSMMGVPELRRALAAHEARFYGLGFDWQTETLVTSGATEALAACLLGLLEPGDEAVLLQPAYDAYAPLIRRAGATPRFVTLRPPDFRLETAELERAFGPKTKLVVLNNPLNPLGRVFSESELDALARLVEAFDAYAVCDEVYEHLVFDGRRHVPFISRPGMRPRTLKIGSAGKTFSLTGWKVGLVVGPAELVRPVSRAHQFLTFTTPPNLQAAVAFGLGLPDGYFEGLAAEQQRRRDRLAGGLRSLGLEALPCEGTYFLNLDIRSAGFEGDDVAFCRQLIEQVGVAAIPVSAFYEETPVRHLARLCFTKQDAVIDRALERFAAHFRK